MKDLTTINGPVFGFKGFKRTNGKLMCREMEYEVGKTYVLGQSPEMCGKGFHFCQRLKDVDQHYGFHQDDNAYFTVRASGVIIEDSNKTKMVCSTIELLEEVTLEDIAFLKLKDHMKEVNLAYESNPNLIISGSLALILRGVIKPRKIGDLDFALPTYEELKGVSFESEFGSSGQECNQITLNNGVKFDLFINPTTRWDWIEFDGRKYKVAGVKQIVEAKWRYLLEGKFKHSEDLKSFLDMVGTVDNYDRNIGKELKEKTFIMDEETFRLKKKMN